MSFRLRITILVSVAVAAAIVGTSFVVYYTDRSELMSQIDRDLVEAETFPPLSAYLLTRAPQFGLFGSTLKKVNTAFAVGTSVSGRGPGVPPKLIVMPGSASAVHVEVITRKAHRAPPTRQSFTDARIGRVWSRVLTISSPLGGVRISRPLTEVDRNLSRLRWLLVLISGGGVGVAALLGAFVSRKAVAPLRRLTETTEQIVETGDLKRRIGSRGRDEISRLSSRLDELLAMLEDSLASQRQLVADASHELRTPIAALRANIELLATPDAVEERDRAELLADVQDELEAMTTLVGELVELARGEEHDVTPRAFRLDEVVQAAVDRASRRSSEISFNVVLEECVIIGVPERVERAVANVLDNARKWSPPGATIDVTARDAAVEVRDRGPGIAAEDRPYVFNRFYRARSARAMSGAGLGLAIVKQIADAHGGTVSVGDAPGGGTVVRLRLSPTR